MANFTPNVNLEKPLGSEHYLIPKFNANMDKIDNAIGNIKNTALTTSHIEAKANKVQEDWIEPTLLNGWVNIGGYGNAAYYKDEFGRVTLKGFLMSGTIRTHVFVLPIGYRPTNTIEIPIVSNDLFGKVEINTVGMVIAKLGSNVTFSLAGISFRAEQ